MAARQLIVPGCMPARDANGRALPSKMRVYLPETTTPATVYTASNLAVALAWPIISDDAGRWPAIWANEDDAFDVAWSDLATDSLIASYTNVQVVEDALLVSAEVAQAAADSAEISAAAADVSAQDAAASAAIAQAPAYTATSHSTITIPVSFPTTVAFALDQPGVFAFGATVKFTLLGDATKHFSGDITALDEDGVGTLSAVISNGTGSGSLWSVGLAAEIDGTLSDRVAELEIPATVAQINAGADATHYTTPDGLADASEPAASTVTGLVTPDFTNTNVFHYLLSGNITLNAPINVGRAGKAFVIRIKQPSSGGPYTLTINSAYDFPFSTAPTLSTTANAIDEISGYIANATGPEVSSRFAKGIG